MRKLNFLTLFSIFFIIKKTTAQTDKVGNWFVYFGNQKINSRYNLHNEIQYRNFNFIGETNQLLIRVGIGFNIKKHNFLVGYGNINSFLSYDTAHNKLIQVENRIYQQFLTKHAFHAYSFIHRIRMEERFIKKNIEYRFRYFISATKALNNSEIKRNTIYLSAYNEIFIKPINNFFDRNRIFGGIGFAFNKYLKTEIGYMVQTTNTTSQKQTQIILYNSFPIKAN